MLLTRCLRSLRVTAGALTALVLGLVSVPVTSAADKTATTPEHSSAANVTSGSSIAPRRPVLPPASPEATNPIDRLLAPYFRDHGIAPGPVVDDRLFARRASLDIVGLLPTPEELQEFAADSRPDKRERLIDSLLAQDDRYAEHWLSFWNDALRNDYRGTGYIDGGRKPITRWLYAALRDNMPYDQFVRELINPSPESEGFIKGIVWRGVVNASQVPPVQAAQNVSQVFLGINLKCASCHDSFINSWQLTDAYGFASIFAADKLEIHHCDQPTGQYAPMKFIYPELGAMDANAPRPERLRRLAEIITHPENGRLTRTIVNRLWKRFLGRGLIEPADEMDNPPWNQDLLDWLAVDLADHGYDLKHTMRLILTSRAYQLASVGQDDVPSTEFVFRGPLVRRLSAEQYLDAVSSLIGPVYTMPAVSLSGPPRIAAKWLWSDADALQQSHHERIFLRRQFTLAQIPTVALAVPVCDKEFILWVNGRRVGEGKDWQRPRAFDLRGHLRKGTNIIAVEATNSSASQTPGGQTSAAASRAGFLFFAKLRYRPDAEQGKTAEHVWDLGSDADWRWSSESREGWELIDFDDSDWRPAVELADAAGGPWNLLPRISAAFDVPEPRPEGVRASLVTADPLQTALGRTNREQVVTTRADDATTLQALELTNGPTLAAQLRRGAQAWISRHTPMNAETTNRLIDELYESALSREPTKLEREAATELVGSPPSAAGVEDLLWILVMLPEFQLIY